MKKLLPVGTLGLAGVVGIGLMSFSGSTVSAQVGDDAYTKREEAATELVLVDDDDDDDTNGTSRFTGNSRSTGDNTASNFTKVSRDRDWSRSDKTKDFTYDGPGSRIRDWTPNLTNDRSRNDSRGSRWTNDGTRSNFTPISRDRDWSKGDKTKDWTHDGAGPLKRDWSANRTNDRSQSDTRR